MRNISFIVLAGLLLSGLNATASTTGNEARNEAPQKAKKCLFPHSRKRAPAWVCSEQDGNITVGAVGSFHKSEAGYEFMEQMATADARAKLVQKLNAPVLKRISENKISANPDRNLVNKIIEDTLQGSKVLKKTYGPKGKLYVLIGFDALSAQKHEESIIAAYRERR